VTAHHRVDIIVVGGGHAGLEAALAAARLGARTVLVTHGRHEVGRMPCNPAIGGLGKGHLVRELDVLGGEMGRVIDQTGIQFRVLNRRKGPAVRAPRAQADKHRYQAAMSAVVEAQAGLTVVEGDAAALLDRLEEGRPRVLGVRLADGREVRGRHVILCTGTFLRGLMHVGEQRTHGGREGAASSEGLSPQLVRLGLQLRRLKTGTPPRLHAASIDTTGLEPQPGDADAPPFSFRTRAFAPPSHLCWLAYTTPQTHAIIRANLHRSPLFAGAIEGQGPRYCPSIEDKVVRFADRERHLVFLEPEGLDTDEVYVNGISTSLPADVQVAMVRSIPGLERAELLRYGYAVEYDSVPSWQVTARFTCKDIAGLSLAGQILGTSGYEEAAAQGLAAGVNAVRLLGGGDPWVLGRDQAYLGVLVDDLATKEITEPYRMFTSRAEHRLALRCDNAETRLVDAAADLGLLAVDDLAQLHRRREVRDDLVAMLEAWRTADPAGGAPTTAAALMRRPDLEPDDVFAAVDQGDELRRRWEGSLDRLDGDLPRRGVVDDVLNSLFYVGYISKQQRLLAEAAHLDELEIPEGFDYRTERSLSTEAREKLERMRPATLGQASRIDGVRAGDLAVLSVLVRRRREVERREESA
jgi:tRNA uridine 5-carboxymethylaminomethyl modification enzyme